MVSAPVKYEAACIVEHGSTAIAEYGHIKIEGQNEMGNKWVSGVGSMTPEESFVRSNTAVAGRPKARLHCPHRLRALLIAEL